MRGEFVELGGEVVCAEGGDFGVVGCVGVEG